MDLDRLLRLSPDERGTVGLTAGAAFLSAAGLTIAASSIDALLFANGGVEKLPTLYLLLGVTMFAASLGVSALLARLGRGRAFLAIPLAIGTIAILARIALLADASWIYPVLWLLRGAAEFLLSLAVWGFAGLVTDTRQAKRFFPLIGGAAVLGQVLGGLATKPLAAAIGTDNLLVVWIGALAMVAVLGRRLAARAGATATAPPRHRGSVLDDVRQGLRTVRRSALLRWMSVGSILFSTLFFSLYLPFSAAATARYPAPDDLAGFFGLFFAVSTAVTLVLSLLVMNRLLSRVGVPNVMLILPLVYLVAFGVLTISAGFVLLLVFRFVQVVWLQGGASTTWEAVTNTVPPDRRDQTRAFLYGGPTQVGTILAGVVAIIGQRAVSPRVLFAIGLGAAAAALYSMLRVRRAYVDELVVALREGRPEVFGSGPNAAEPFGVVAADRAALSVATTSMIDPDPGVRRVAAELLGDLDAPDATAALMAGLSDDDPEVRATSLRSLTRSGAVSASEEIPDRLADRSPEVRLAALDALAELRADRVRARPLLEDPDGLVRARAAAIVLGDGGSDQAAEAVLDRLARSPHADARAAALKATAAVKTPASIQRARAALADASPGVRAAAARALATLDPDGSVEDLIAAAAEGGGSLLATAGESVGALGEPGAEAARDLARRSAARAVQVRGLADGIDATANARLELLRDSLLAESERSAIGAIRASALLGDRARIATAAENLAAADPGQRANALEVIEMAADREIVRPLLPLYDPGRRGAGNPGWRSQVLRDPDPWIRTCAAWALATGEEEPEAAASGAEANPGPPRTTTPEGGTMTETLTTVPLMERVLFLRRVPLFADLPPQDLRPIAEVATEHSFEDGDAIAGQGESGDEMHVIVSGHVLVVVAEGGATRTLAVRTEGDVIGEMAVITSRPRMAGLVARGPVRLLSIARRPFEAILRERPEIAMAVMRVLCDRLADRDATPSVGADAQVPDAPDAPPD
jgi:HEAT repeat protein